MISRTLATKLFDAFSIFRWNDRIRPVDLVEMDKHALKSALTYFIAKIEQLDGKEIDWEYIVYGNVFAILKNIALSDIKSSIITKIKSEYPDNYKELNYWVVKQYEQIVDDGEFLDRFRRFLMDDEGKELELDILKAAHKYSTKREFDIIKSANMSFPEITLIEGGLKRELEKYTKFKAISLLNNESDFYNALCLIEQLRYETRWSQTPRIPRTSVLGHSMYVALLIFFMSRELHACPKRLVNNFYAAIFHDLPESVTRDIISPVKRATSDFPQIIKQIEKDICETELYPKFPAEIVPDLKYLLGDTEDINDEFCNRIIVDKKIRDLSNDSRDRINEYNNDEYMPVDGCLIKVCDEIAAYMEAQKSVEYGISSHHLQDGISYIRSKYMSCGTIQGINIAKFFIEFN